MRTLFCFALVTLLAAPVLAQGRVVVQLAPAKAHSPAHKEAVLVYMSRCVVCHGPSGAGDGVAAMGMNPKPRAFADAEWQKSVTDSALLDVIVKGGAAVGKSPLMPANADLLAPVAEALVVLIRDQARAKISATLTPAEGTATSFDGVLQVDRVFSMPKIAPGVYELKGFVDLDGDGKAGKEPAFSSKVEVTEKGASVVVTPK